MPSVVLADLASMQREDVQHAGLTHHGSPARRGGCHKGAALLVIGKPLHAASS
jgi:hypothetical protein